MTPKDVQYSSPQHNLVADVDAGNRTTITDPSMIDEIVVHYRRVGRALRAADPADWASGLTMPQLRVLFLLGRSEPMPVGSVAEAMRISQPSVTETVDRLVRAGLVTRTRDGALACPVTAGASTSSAISSAPVVFSRPEVKCCHRPS